MDPREETRPPKTLSDHPKCKSRVHGLHDMSALQIFDSGLSLA